MTQNKHDNHDSERTEYKQEAGSEGKEWTVILKERREVNGREVREYIVHYPDRNKSQVVTLDAEEGDHCTCTYFDYNPSCPHIRASQLLKQRTSAGKVRKGGDEL